MVDNGIRYGINLNQDPCQGSLILDICQARLLNLVKHKGFFFAVQSVRSVQLTLVGNALYFTAQYKITTWDTNFVTFNSTIPDYCFVFFFFVVHYESHTQGLLHFQVVIPSLCYDCPVKCNPFCSKYSVCVYYNLFWTTVTGAIRSADCVLPKCFNLKSFHNVFDKQICIFQFLLLILDTNVVSFNFFFSYC